MKNDIPKVPRGIRNNNPLNIAKTDDRWQGQIHKNVDPRFCEFSEMKYGYRAAAIILKKYIKAYGYNTVRKIIVHWAPPFENNTEKYIDAVCRFMQVGDDYVMDFANMADMLMLMSAMTVVENGSYYNPQKLYFDLWKPMYDGYKMACGSRRNLAALDYSPELHHEIHDVEFKELLAQRVGEKDYLFNSNDMA